MRFYGLYILILTLCLLALPLFSQGTSLFSEDDKKELVDIQENLPTAVITIPVDNDEKEELSEKESTIVTATDLNIRSFRIKNASSGAVDTVPVEEFVLGAVCSEMPATFHIEALKAQAVSARTWAVYQQLWQEQHPDEALNGADFQSDPYNWKGYVTEEQARERFGELFDEYWSALTKAVKETEGQILCVNEQPIAAAYHAISAGKTESAENVWGSPISYLQPVDSRGDELAPGFEETVTITEQELKSLYSSVEFSGEAASWLEVLERSESDYVTKIRVGSIEQSGLEFRTTLGLRSSNFNISYEEQGFHITTRGYGHGAGLSQYGADFMARQGSSYEEILCHYYQGAKLENLS